MFNLIYEEYIFVVVLWIMEVMGKVCIIFINVYEIILININMLMIEFM